LNVAGAGAADEHAESPHESAVRVVFDQFGLIKYHDRKDLITQFERDRLLRDAGYKVVHFTWRELFETPEIVIARLRRALADKGAW
jgi:very-short-patch-repair endonuclease